MLSKEQKEEIKNKVMGAMVGLPLPTRLEDTIRMAITATEIALQPPKEFTKITNIPCRDCGLIVSILSGNKSQIFDARCPSCQAVFIKEAKQFNRELGYKTDLSPTQMISFAMNGSFGLERFLLAGLDFQSRKLIEQGIIFCEYIRISDNSQEDVKKRLKGILDSGIAADTEIRDIQRFFVRASSKLLEIQTKSRPIKQEQK